VTKQPSPESGRLAVALARLLTRDGLTTAVVTLTADPALVPRALSRNGRGDLDAVLAGAVPWNEALQPLGERGPWLLAPAGRRAKDAVRPRLGPLLGELARRFDRVLVAAGGLERAETLRAARDCQFALVLVARGRVRGDALIRDVAELEAVGARPDGLVLLR
jgi:hypothetical protein